MRLYTIQDAFIQNSIVFALIFSIYIIIDGLFGTTYMFTLVTFYLFIVSSAFYMFMVLKINNKKYSESIERKILKYLSIISAIVSLVKFPLLIIFSLIVFIVVFQIRRVIKSVKLTDEINEKIKENNIEFSRREERFVEYMKDKNVLSNNEKINILEEVIYFNHLGISFEKIKLNTKALQELIPLLSPKKKLIVNEIIESYSIKYDNAVKEKAQNLVIVNKSTFPINIEGAYLIENDIEDTIEYIKRHLK